MKIIYRLFFVSVFAVLFSGLGVGSVKTGLAQSGDPVFVGAGDITNCSPSKTS